VTAAVARVATPDDHPLMAGYAAHCRSLPISDRALRDRLRLARRFLEHHPDLVFQTERGTPVNPNHASRAFARLAASAGLAAHPHMLRHALASAMAAHKEPASIIAAQLRHADGGALAQRTSIHQLPQTAPRLAGLIEDVFGRAARDMSAAPAQGSRTR
jgi:integrase